MAENDNTEGQDYIVVSAYYPDELARNVAEKRKLGWRIWGSLQVIVLPDRVEGKHKEYDRVRMYQPMILPNDSGLGDKG